MLKTLFKNSVWMVLPLGLVIGCAENRPSTVAYDSPAYHSAPDAVVLQPTSSEPEQRIYQESNANTLASGGAQNVTVSAVPAGASQQKWALAEEIRQKLTSDMTLAPLGSMLIANVGDDGVVTLKGTVRSDSEEKRVCDTIAQLPGVRGVDNQLKIGMYHVTGKVTFQRLP